MTRVYLALGSNLGDRAGNLARARRQLHAGGVEVLRESQVRETEPFGITEQPRFLNQVLEGGWPGSPRELLQVAKATEAAVGRTAGERWGPREIDVDIVLFGDEVVSEPGLEIPHPGLTDRVFVLEPLLELNPELHDPRTGDPLADCLRLARLAG